MFERRQVKTHSQLVRDELSEGFGHLWQAAAHAAGGVGATVGPKWDSAKGHLPPGAGKMRDAAARGLDSTVAAFAPLMDAARVGATTAARQAQKAAKKAGKRRSGRVRRRRAILVGLLAASAAAGTAGAIIARRRNRAKWEEYEARGVEAARGYAESAFDTARTAADKTASAAARTADTMEAARTADTMEQDKAKADQFAEKAHTISKNNRGS